MKLFFSKTVIIFIVLFGFFNTQQVYGQQEVKYVTVCQVFDNLVFGLRFNNNIAEINKWLIKQIQERGVDFKLESKEEENSFRKIGASDLLIKAIRENYSKELEEKSDLYKKFTENYASKNPEQLKIAIESGKEFVKRYREDESVKEIVDYLVKTIPALERRINCCEPDTDRYTKFDRALKNKNWEDLLEVSAEILVKQPELVDAPLAVASLGFDETANKKDPKYLDQTLLYAEKAIELLENGNKSVTENYGVLNYSFKTKEFPDGKANALGYMNYIIGYINYFYLNQKDEAIPYFQKSLQYKSKSNELVRQLNLAISK